MKLLYPALYLLLLVIARTYTEDLNTSLANLNTSLNALKIHLEATQLQSETKPKDIPSIGLKVTDLQSLESFYSYYYELYGSIKERSSHKLRSKHTPINRDLSAELYERKIVEQYLGDIETNIQKYLLNEAPHSKIEQFATDQNKTKFTTLLTRMIISGIIEDFSGLQRCRCMPADLRIYFNIRLLNDIFTQFPDTSQPIVYTSMGSGGLWQDYLIIQALMWAGYINIHLNLIDISYPDVWAIKAYEDQLKADNTVESEKNHSDFIHDFMLKYTHDIESLKVLLGTEASKIHAQKGITINLETHLYNNPYEYIERAKRYPFERTNILVMVDPDMELPRTMNDYPSLANMIELSIEDPSLSKDFAHFRILIPKNKPIQIYHLNRSDSPNTQLFQQTKEELKQLANTTGAIKGFSSKFYNELINTGDIGPKKITTPLKSLRFMSDAFMSFQDLVFDALSDRAMVYTLIRTHGTRDGVINKIDIAEYKERDPAKELGQVFTTYGYKKMDLN